MIGPINITGLRNCHSAFLRALTKEIDTAAKAALVEIKHEVDANRPFKRPTGALAKATKYRFVKTRRGNVIRVSNSKKYALAQERGAKPHIIRARRAKYLRFVMNGKVVYRKSVRHPGNKPTRWLLNATFAGGRVEYRALRDGMTRTARLFRKMKA